MSTASNELAAQKKRKENVREREIVRIVERTCVRSFHFAVRIRVIRVGKLMGTRVLGLLFSFMTQRRG